MEKHIGLISSEGMGMFLTFPGFHKHPSHGGDSRQFSIPLNRIFGFQIFRWEKGHSPWDKDRRNEPFWLGVNYEDSFAAAKFDHDLVNVVRMLNVFAPAQLGEIVTSLDSREEDVEEDVEE